jgi:RNA polymerase sigma-70 factor (ECF subfamily)
MDKTPASLLEKLRQPGQPHAWNRFVDLFTPLLYHWARGVGLQSSDASDLVQDVLLLLLRKLPDFHYDPHRSFRAWLKTVTLNRWRSGRRAAGLPREPGANSLAEVAGEDPAEALWEAEYQQHLLARALRVMKADFQPTTWKACWEHVVCGRPAAEVAAELGISCASVYSAKSRVLRRLRQELAGLLD